MYNAFNEKLKIWFELDLSHAIIIGHQSDISQLSIEYVA